MRIAIQMFWTGAKTQKRPRRDTTGLNSEVTSICGEGSPNAS
jgi:hypothetical protein